MYRITFFISLLVLVLSTPIEINKEEATQDALSELNITAPFTIMREISKGNKLQEYKLYAEDIQKRGSVLLKNLSKLIIELYGLKEDGKPNIKSSIENFKNNVKSSRNFVARLDQEFGIDDVYMFNDLLETCCKIIFMEQKRFLHNLEDKKNSGNIVLELHQTIFMDTVSFKTNELLCLCKNYGICVPHSPFTSHFEYFIDEILLLPEPEIGMIINLLSELVRNDNHFLRLVKSDPKTVLAVKVLFTNTYNMKQSIIVLRNLIKKRHVLVSAPEYKQQIRIQAARALLDTIDKAFHFDHSDKFSIDIYATIKAVRDWGTAIENYTLTRDKTDVYLYKMAIRKFINTIFQAINFKKNDINRYLIKTMVTGTLENGTGYEHLFKNGFKGLFICPSYGGNSIGTLKLDKHNAKINQMPKSPDVKSKALKKFFPPLPISPAPFHTYETDRLNDYSKHIMTQGMNIIKYSAAKMLNQVGNENSLAVYSVTTDYVSKIQEFLDHLKENHGRYSSQPVGEEFMIMNMLEKACEILYQQQWILLSRKQMNSTKDNISRIQKLSKFINGQIKQWRTEEMQYICSTFHICKPYPAFSNRLEYLILELLRLPDSKLNIFVDHVKNIVAKNKEFLALVGGVQGKNKTFKRINDLCRNKSLKESLTSVRGVLSHKFKISQTQSNTKNQATQVLLDIIDKAFLFNRDKSIVLDFEKFDEVIKKWGKNKVQLDIALLEQLINAVFKTINAINNPVKGTLIKTVMWID